MQLVQPSFQTQVLRSTPAIEVYIFSSQTDGIRMNPPSLRARQNDPSAEVHVFSSHGYVRKPYPHRHLSFVPFIIFRTHGNMRGIRIYLLQLIHKVYQLVPEVSSMFQRGQITLRHNMRMQDRTGTNQ